MVLRICLLCKKEFNTYPCHIKKGKGNFCSISCSVKSQWKNQPNFRWKSKYERFYLCISKENHLENCWEWSGGSTNKSGYGRFFDGDKKYLAHRYSWVLYNGDIPDDILVLHKCDNPSCVNPEHLFLGTQLDNMNDMRQKGRSNYKKKQSHQHK